MPANVLYGKLPGNTYTQLPVFLNPAGGDYTLVRDTGDGSTSEYAPVHAKGISTNLFRARTSTDTDIFNVDGSTEEVFVRITRDDTTGVDPATLAIGQLYANITDGKLYLGGDGEVFTFLDSSQTGAHTHPLSELNQGGAASGNMIIWSNSSAAWVATSVLVVDPSPGTESLTINGSLTVTGDFTVDGQFSYLNVGDLAVEDKNIVINRNGTIASANGAGITIHRSDAGGGSLAVKLVYDPGTYSDSGWAIYHGLAMAEIITSASSIGADQIADFSVTDTEYQYLAGVTSAIQDQLDGKASSSHNHDLVYSALGHDHAGTYAVLAHDHDGSYYTHTELATDSSSFIHWANLTNKPTTVAGYGITDGYTKTEVDALTWDWSDLTSGVPTTIAGYGITDAYTKTETDALTWDWSDLTSGVPTTLAGYGITDAYTQTELQGDGTASVHFNNLTNTPTTISGYGITDAYTKTEVQGDGTAALHWGNLTNIPVAIANVDDRLAATQEPTGIPDATKTSMTFTEGTRTFSISPSASEYDIWILGVQHTITTEKTIVIPDTEGLHHIYFDTDGELAQTMTFDPHIMIGEKVYVCNIYWDATNSKAVVFGDERHGLMPWQIHLLWHDKMGTQRLSGMAIGDMVTDANGALDTHAEMSITAGAMIDEDITLALLALTAPASIPVIYRTGTNGDWRKDIARTAPVKQGTTLLAYNEWTGATWQQTELTNNKFVLAHILASNDTRTSHQYIAVQGQNVYGSSSAAREGANTEVNSLVVSGLPFQEFVFVGTLIYQTSNAFGNSFKAKTISTDSGTDYVDWRSTELSPGVAPTSHANLTETGVVNSHPALAIATDPTNFNAILSATEDSVQKALDILDDHAHDGVYYTETELDAGQLDNRYYTETELQGDGTAAVHFNNLTSTPTTVAGYGITDAYTKTETDALTWDWSDLVSGVPTTLSGYGITDAYTKTELQGDGTASVHFNNLTSTPTTVAGYGITDAMTTAHAANAITGTDITNWGTAYGWGDHAGLYLLLATGGTVIGDVTIGQADNADTAFNVNSGDPSNIKQSIIRLQHNDVSKWAVYKTTANDFGIYNYNIAGISVLIDTATNIADFAVTPTVGGTAVSLTTHAHVVNDLTDVNAPTPTDGQILQWEDATSKWVNVTLSGAGHNHDDVYFTETELSGDGTATVHWNNITSTPTTIAGYGITDAYTKTETDALTWDWSDIVSGTPTTLSGYGITDAMSTSHAANGVTDVGSGVITSATERTQWDTAYSHSQVVTGNPHDLSLSNLNDVYEWRVDNVNTDTGERVVAKFLDTAIGTYDGVSLSGWVIDHNSNYGDALPTVTPFSMYIKFSGTQIFDLNQDVATSNIILKLRMVTTGEWRLIANLPVAHKGVHVIYRIHELSGCSHTQGSTSTIDASGTERKATPDYGTSSNHEHTWSQITSGVPTTVSGYGITDAYTKTEVNALTWDWSDLTSGVPTTVAGYGITDAMTTAHDANGIATADITNWDTAHGWGDHGVEGYLTSADLSDYTKRNVAESISSQWEFHNDVFIGDGTNSHILNLRGTAADTDNRAKVYYRHNSDSGISTSDPAFRIYAVDSLGVNQKVQLELYTGSAYSTIIRSVGTSEFAGGATFGGGLTATGYNNSNWDTAYTHANGSTGADHTYINQAVTTTSEVVFDKLTLTQDVIGAEILSLQGTDTASVTNTVHISPAKENGIGTDQYNLAFIQQTTGNRWFYFRSLATGTMGLDVQDQIVAGGMVTAKDTTVGGTGFRFSGYNGRVLNIANGANDRYWKVTSNSTADMFLTFTNESHASGKGMHLGVNNATPTYNLDVYGDFHVTDASVFDSTVTWSGGGSANANTAYSYSQVGHLPLAGGTLTGSLTVPDSDSFNAGGHRYSRRVVSASSTVFVTLTHTNGGALGTAYNYHVRLGITSTGTVTGASYVVWWDSATAAWKVRHISRAGSSSNHPEIFLDGGIPKIKTSHANEYSIFVAMDATYTQNVNIAGHTAGADFHWQRSGDALTYADGSVNITSTLSVGSTVTWSGGGSANANTAYSWGDHGVEGYITAADLSNYTERDVAEVVTGAWRFTQDLDIGTGSGTSMLRILGSSGDADNMLRVYYRYNSDSGVSTADPAIRVYAVDDTDTSTKVQLELYNGSSYSTVIRAVGISELAGGLTAAGDITATGDITSNGTVIGNVVASGDGSANVPFRIEQDYSSWMIGTAGGATPTWGLFWAGTSGARYGTNGFGGPGDIWSNVANPNEFVFVGSDVTKWTLNGNTGDTWQLGSIWATDGTFSGVLDAEEKHFRINHPTPSKRNTHKLLHGSLEGPENGVYVRGTIEGNTITLPDYWKDLVHADSISCVITPLGKPQSLFIKDISTEEVVIGKPWYSFRKIKAQYFIKATRKDVKKLIVEQKNA